MVQLTIAQGELVVAFGPVCTTGIADDVDMVIGGICGIRFFIHFTSDTKEIFKRISKASEMREVKNNPGVSFPCRLVSRSGLPRYHCCESTALRFSVGVGSLAPDDRMDAGESLRKIAIPCTQALRSWPDRGPLQPRLHSREHPTNGFERRTSHHSEEATKFDAAA